MRAVLTIAHLTLAEARRRRILAAALLLGAAFVLLFALGFHFIVRDVRAHGATAAQQRLVLSIIALRIKISGCSAVYWITAVHLS